MVSPGQPWLHNKTLSKNKHANKKKTKPGENRSHHHRCKRFYNPRIQLDSMHASVTTAKTTKEERHFEMQHPGSRCDYCVAAVAPCPPAGYLG